MDEWSADLLTELPRTPRGFNHLLVVVEAVSGFVDAYPLKRRTAKEVAAALRYHWSVFGVPRRLRVDQGSEFEGEVAENCDSLGIQLKIISSHHPQSNGQVERKNRDIIDSLTKTATDEDWDLDILQTLQGLRRTNSRRTGRSPHEILFGEPARVPGMLEITPDEEVKMDAEFLGNQWRRRQDLIKSTRNALKRYEAGTDEIQEGHLVWIRNFGRKKFDPRWIGPSVVIQRQSFSVKVKSENGRERVINLSDIKPYRVKTNQENPHAVGGAVVVAGEVVTDADYQVQGQGED
jgi:hypothetical protein